MNERCIVWIAVLAIALLAPMAAEAALTWDGDTGAGATGVQDGSGTWKNQDASYANWWDGFGNVQWNNANMDTAVFGTGVSVTAPYTVTVDAGGVTAGGMTFDTGGDQTANKYYFKGGPITFAAASGTPTLSYPSTTSNTYPEIWSNISVAGDIDVTNTGTQSSYIYLGDGDATTNSWSGVMRLTTDSASAYAIGVQFNNGEALGGSMEIMGMGGLVSFLGNETYSLPSGKSITIRGYGGATLVPHNARGALMGGNTFATGHPTPVLDADVILADNSAICSANTSGAGAFTIQGDISETGGSRKLTVTGSTTLILAGNCTYTGGTDVLKGILQVDGTLGTAGSTVTVGSGSGATALKGNGAVTGDVVLNANSSIRPGASAGKLTINDPEFDMSAAGTMIWELGTLSTDNPGVNFDQLAVNGNLTVSGFLGTAALNLDFNLLAEEDRPDYATPRPFWHSDHAWKIIDATSNTYETNFGVPVNGAFASGTFSTSIGTGADAGDIFLNFVTALSPIQIPGDADEDGKVDSADAARVASYWGATELAAGKTWWQMGDFDSSESIDGADAAILAANWHYGVSEGAVVPEPGALSLLLVGLVAMARGRWRGRQR